MGLNHAQAGTVEVCICVFIIFLALGCGKKEGQTRSPAQAIPVTVSAAVLTNLPVVVESIGHVTSYSMIQVQSQVDGQLARVGFVQGELVNEGDLIFEIDPRPFEATLRQAQATQAKDAAIQTRTAAEARRTGTLFTNGIIAADAYDEAKANAEAAKATVAADAAAVDNAKLQLSYCFIRSPVTGRTGNLLVTPGNIVKKQETVLATINQTRPIYVDFTTPEKMLPEIRKYFQQHKLTTSASIPGGDISYGTLLVIGNTIETNTGNVALRAVFPNEDELLWPGQFVDVVLTLTVRSNVVAVPLNAIQLAQNEQGAFVVRPDSTVEYRAVTPGIRTGSLQVIEKGIKAEELVVTQGQLRLTPGSKVTVTQRNQERGNMETGPLK